MLISANTALFKTHTDAAAAEVPKPHQLQRGIGYAMLRPMSTTTLIPCIFNTRCIGHHFPERREAFANWNNPEGFVVVVSGKHRNCL